MSLYVYVVVDCSYRAFFTASVFSSNDPWPVITYPSCRGDPALGPIGFTALLRTLGDWFSATTRPGSWSSLSVFFVSSEASGPIIVAEADYLFRESFLCRLVPLWKTMMASEFSPLGSEPDRDSGLLGGTLLYYMMLLPLL